MPSSAKPTTNSPVTAPPRKAAASALATPRRADSATRALARTETITPTAAIVVYCRFRYAEAPSCTAAEIWRIRSVPADSASSEREVSAPYSSAAPEHPSATRTPCCVKMLVKVPPRAVRSEVRRPQRQRGKAPATPEGRHPVVRAEALTQTRRGSVACAPNRRRSAPRHPEPAAALRGPRLTGARALDRRLLSAWGPGLPAGRAAARRRGLASASPRSRTRRRRCLRPAPDPHVRELQLRERLPDLADLAGGRLLKQRQQGADRLDRQLHLSGVALGLGAGLQAGAAHPQIGQHHDVLQEHVLDSDPLELRFVGGPQLLLAGLRFGAAHCRTSSSARRPPAGGRA